MLAVNKERFDQLVREKKYVDAATLMVVTIIANDNDLPINKVLLTGITYNSLAFASKDMNETEIFNDLLNPDSDFFQNNIVLIKRKVSLALENKVDTYKKGLPIIDQRSVVAESILQLYCSINQNSVKYNPQESLLPDLIDKTIKQGLGIVKMLNLGLYSDAFGSWRTFHESLCIIKILIRGGKKTQDAYLKHIIYSNAFRGAIPDENESDLVFAEMKGEMKSYGLKSKDMKKFIEYGWLYSFAGFKIGDPDYKLNFRDGIQRCADLRQYSEWYEAASELSHSSAIYFYSESEYFSDLTIHGFFDMLGELKKINIEVYPDSIKGIDESLESELDKMIIDQKLFFEAKYFGENDADQQD